MEQFATRVEQLATHVELETALRHKPSWVVEAQTYITGQCVLKLDNWIPRGTRGRAGLQAEITVLSKKGGGDKTHRNHPGSPSGRDTHEIDP